MDRSSALRRELRESVSRKMRDTGATTLGFYLEHRAALCKIADELSVPCFSTLDRKELSELLGGMDAVLLVEGYSRFQNYGDILAHAESRKSVSTFLRRQGVALPKGKRTNPGLEELVKDLAPILLHLGLPLATSEHSRIVEALRFVASEQNVPGDPRDELRRQVALSEHQIRVSRSAVRSIIADAARSAFGIQSKKRL